ncbi:uncharacterized protein LOC133191659 [Saccostrea echinata]|uniref:uncharacterized protein LOC133191659 n=1 Tax=Saccostrea echinata TaxID=191078 RepID=UPI002A7FAF22|nr:uncharacterized protein LOC133191659 [Saccostrea echinata]
MWKLVYICVVLYLFLDHVTDTEGSFVVHITPLSFIQAVKVCELGYNGKLVGMYDVSNDIMNQLSENTKYWTNEYTVLSDWINHEGCYNTSILPISAIMDISIKPHTVASCYEECSNAKLIALQDGRCWCLSGTVQESDRLDTSLCTSTCTGKDEYEFCGGEELLSIYSKFQEADDSKLHHRRCSYYKCNSTNPNGILAADFCNGTHSIICKTERYNSSSLSIDTYHAAVDHCHTNGGLVYNNPTTGRALCDIRVKIYHNKGFWTSIHRYEQFLDADDGIKKIEKSYRCKVLFVRNKVIQARLEPCYSTEKRPFICKSETAFVYFFAEGTTISSVYAQNTKTEERTTISSVYAQNTKTEELSESSISGLVAGIIVTSLLSVVSVLVVLILARKRFQRKMKRKRTTKFTYRNNMVTVDDDNDNNEIERCESQIGNRHDVNDPERYASTQQFDRNTNEITDEYDSVKKYPLSIISTEKVYDNNSQSGDSMYYEMSPETDTPDDVITNGEETSALSDANTIRVSDNPLPEYLENIYDTAVASIVHENSLRKSAKRSEQNLLLKEEQNCTLSECVNEVPYEAMESLEIPEDNYKEMAGI